MNIELLSDARYALLVPTSMGIRLTPAAAGQPFHRGGDLPGRDLLARDLNGDAERLFRTAAEIGNSTFGPMLERVLIRLALTEN